MCTFSARTQKANLRTGTVVSQVLSELNKKKISHKFSLFVLFIINIKLCSVSLKSILHMPKQYMSIFSYFYSSFLFSFCSFLFFLFHYSFFLYSFFLPFSHFSSFFSFSFLSFSALSFLHSIVFLSLEPSFPSFFFLSSLFLLFSLFHSPIMLGRVLGVTAILNSTARRTSGLESHDISCR